MQVTVKGYLSFRPLVGELRVPLPEGSTLRALLAELKSSLGGEFARQAYDAQGVLLDHVAVLLNGQHDSHLPLGLDTPLKDGDQVSLFPPIAGGC
jgi:molybdopterin synthase sulfur carrier subunit